MSFLEFELEFELLPFDRLFSLPALLLLLLVLFFEFELELDLEPDFDPELELEFELPFELELDLEFLPLSPLLLSRSLLRDLLFAELLLFPPLLLFLLFLLFVPDDEELLPLSSELFPPFDRLFLTPELLPFDGDVPLFRLLFEGEFELLL